MFLQTVYANSGHSPTFPDLKFIFFLLLICGDFRPVEEGPSCLVVLTLGTQMLKSVRIPCSWSGAFAHLLTGSCCSLLGCVSSFWVQVASPASRTRCRGAGGKRQADCTLAFLEPSFLPGVWCWASFLASLNWVFVVCFFKSAHYAVF